VLSYVTLRQRKQSLTERLAEGLALAETERRAPGAALAESEEAFPLDIPIER